MGGPVAILLNGISMVTDNLDEFFSLMNQLEKIAIAAEPSGQAADIPKPEESIVQVQRHDVLLGRGGETNHHIGNIQYRQLVKACQPAYLAAKRRDKPRIAAAIVGVVRARSGRFLKKHAVDNAWKDVGNVRAREKTSQALREGAPELRGSSGTVEASRTQLLQQAVASSRAQQRGLSDASAVAAALDSPMHYAVDQLNAMGGVGSAGASSQPGHLPPRVAQGHVSPDPRNGSLIKGGTEYHLAPHHHHIHGQPPPAMYYHPHHHHPPPPPPHHHHHAGVPPPMMYHHQHHHHPMAAAMEHYHAQQQQVPYPTTGNKRPMASASSPSSSAVSPPPAKRQASESAPAVATAHSPKTKPAAAAATATATSTPTVEPATAAAAAPSTMSTEETKETTATIAAAAVSAENSEEEPAVPPPPRAASPASSTSSSKEANGGGGAGAGAGPRIKLLKTRLEEKAAVLAV
jgi:hypothetical protein